MPESLRGRVIPCAYSGVTGHTFSNLGGARPLSSVAGSNPGPNLEIRMSELGTTKTSEFQRPRGRGGGGPLPSSPP